jgi:5-methylcytosine-specific restriction enzyme B
MYLLEYRKDQNDQGEANELSEATIPHREEPFSVPPNVVVIGTMNTSDRSIGQIDLALRRRFHFFPLGPNERVLKAVLDANASTATATALKLFRNVNKRVRDEAHLEGDIIGHSFFMAKNLTEDLLRLRYQYSVVPMLEEIFYARPEIIASHFRYDALLAEPATQSTPTGNLTPTANSGQTSDGGNDSAST